MTPSVFGKFGQPRKPFIPLEPGSLNLTPCTPLAKAIANQQDILQALVSIEAAMGEPVWITLSDQQKAALKQDVQIWTASSFEDVAARAIALLAKF